MTRVLLVTGARSLATRDGAEAWTRGLLQEALAGVELLIVGDAPGPDAWTWEDSLGIVESRHRYWTRREHAGSSEASFADGSLHAWWTWGSRNTHPLARNAAMVTDAAGYRDGDDDTVSVSVLALLDGPKVDTPTRRATRGTEHTVRLAMAAGLSVREEVWNA